MGRDLSGVFQVVYAIVSFGGVIVGKLADYYGFAIASFINVSSLIIAYVILLTDSLYLQYIGKFELRFD